MKNKRFNAAKPHLSLKTQQMRFAKYLRDPEHNPKPESIEDRRLHIYRDLFFNNIESFLSNHFPVLRSMMDAKCWYALVRDFFASHVSHSPYFLDIPLEFLDYCQKEGKQRVNGIFPFFYELAHYEWVGRALSVSDETPEASFDEEGDLIEGCPLVSPLAWLLTYFYPVHRIGPDHIPEGPSAVPTHLVVYRDTADEIHFMEVNAITARLLEMLDESPQIRGDVLLNQLAGEVAGVSKEALFKGGKEALEALREKGIILGARGC